MCRSRLEISKALTSAGVCYLSHKGYSCFTEIGLNSRGKLRGDIVGVSLKGNLVIIEVKSSRADFVLDRKWLSYLHYCNKFYFCFLPETFECLTTTELEVLRINGVGVLVLDKISGYLKCVKPAKNKLMVRKTKNVLIVRLAWRQGISKRTNRRKRIFLS